MLPLKFGCVSVSEGSKFDQIKTSGAKPSFSKSVEKAQKLQDHEQLLAYYMQEQQQQQQIPSFTVSGYLDVLACMVKVNLERPSHHLSNWFFNLFKFFSTFLL